MRWQGGGGRGSREVAETGSHRVEGGGVSVALRDGWPTQVDLAKLDLVLLFLECILPCGCGAVLLGLFRSHSICTPALLLASLPFPCTCCLSFKLLGIEKGQAQEFLQGQSRGRHSWLVPGPKGLSTSIHLCLYNLQH